MKVAYLDHLFFRLLASLLFLAPSFLGAKVFGYFGLKSGYSYEQFSQTTLFVPKSNLSPSMNASTAHGIPLGLDAGFGYRFTPSFGFRIEAEYLYRFGGKFSDSTLDFGNPTAAPNVDAKHQTTISNLLGNLYLDYYLGSSVYFYVGGGVGSSLSDATIPWKGTRGVGTVSTLKKLSFTWQAGGGLGVLISSNLSLDFNVRYIDFGNAKLRAKGALILTGDLPYKALEGLVGLNYRF